MEVLVDLAVDLPACADADDDRARPHAHSARARGSQNSWRCSVGSKRVTSLTPASWSQRFSKEALLSQAGELDAGFDPSVLAQMMGTIDCFIDDEIRSPTVDVLAQLARKSSSDRCQPRAGEAPAPANSRPSDSSQWIAECLLVSCAPGRER